MNLLNGKRQADFFVLNLPSIFFYGIQIYANESGEWTDTAKANNNGKWDHRSECESKDNLNGAIFISLKVDKLKSEKIFVDFLECAKIKRQRKFIFWKMIVDYMKVDIWSSWIIENIWKTCGDFWVFFWYVKLRGRSWKSFLGFRTR